MSWKWLHLEHFYLKCTQFWWKMTLELKFLRVNMQNFQISRVKTLAPESNGTQCNGIKNRYVNLEQITVKDAWIENYKIYFVSICTTLRFFLRQRWIGRGKENIHNWKKKMNLHLRGQTIYNLVLTKAQRKNKGHLNFERV